MSIPENKHANLPIMRHSLTGRVRNFNLPPTASNGLMPIYEAITNAIYAIQEKFPTNWEDKGAVKIEVIREAGNTDTTAKHNKVSGFIVTDNGVGLHDTLFSHFQVLDTEYRIDKRGRGIGRLSWLKVFELTELTSIFERNENIFQRSFEFKLSNDNPFQNYDEKIQTSSTETGTIVHLSNYKEAFENKAFRNPQDIQNSILAHFVALFAQPKRLKIDLIDEGKKVNLSDLFFKSIVGDKGTVEISIGEGLAANIMHILLPRKIAPMDNSIIYCAGERSVVSKNINEVIGLKYLPSKEYGGLIYIGLVSGDIFDDALNHERTGFDFGDIDFEEINKEIVGISKEFLDPFLSERKEKNKVLLDHVLMENPLYIQAVGNIEQYLETMPLNWDETKLVQDIALKRHRAKNALIKQIQKLEANMANMTDEEFAKHVKAITAQLGETEKSSLAQYVVERKMVIELLKTRRKLDTESGKHKTENIVHEVFCPLGVTSDTMDYDDHNLWLVDDRLAYYSFIASDRPIQSFTTDTDKIQNDIVAKQEELKEIGLFGEKSEPDLAFFKYPMLFRRSNTTDPVVIIEFKSPNKVKYSGAPNDNPVLQIRKYIETLQSKTCHDFEQNRITDINDKTPFHCFLIAEPCEQLYALLRSHAIYKPTPDGDGRFGYMDDLNAYFEFIPYGQVIKNANLRNEAFFKKLNL